MISWLFASGPDILKVLDKAITVEDIVRSSRVIETLLAYSDVMTVCLRIRYSRVVVVRVNTGENMVRASAGRSKLYWLTVISWLFASGPDILKVLDKAITAEDIVRFSRVIETLLAYSDVMTVCLRIRYSRGCR